MTGGNNINSQNQKDIGNQFILKGGIKKEQVDKKYHQLFDMFDSDGNKTLDSNEASSLSALIANINKKDSENDYNKSINDFAQNLSLASKDIIDSETITNSNGEKTIIISYNNGVKETTTYYPDGEIKMKRLDKEVTETTYTVDGKEYTEQEYKKMLEHKFLSSNNNIEMPNVQPSNINIIPNTIKRTATKIDFSERGQQDLRQFTGDHFKETVEEQYNLIQRFDYTSTDLDKVGLLVSDSAQELYSKVSGEDYNTYSELWNETRRNAENSSTLFMAGKVTPNSAYAIAHPEYNFETVYKKTTGQDYNIMQANSFQQTAVKYQALTGLKQRTSMLNDSIKTIETLYKEEQLKKQGITVADRGKTYDEVLMDSLTQYFDGNSKEIKSLTEKRYNQELGGEKYENIKDRYLHEYKEFYGVENRKDEIESNLAAGQATGEMIKMGVVITTSIMLGGSNLLQQAGKALAEKLGPTAAREAIRLGMSMGSIAESYGIDLLAAMTSKEGLTEEKNKALLQKQASNLPYMMFGVYVSGPVGESVKNMLKASPNISSELLKNVFSKATSSAGFATEVSADALFELALNGGDIGGVFGTNAQGEAFARFMNMLVGGRANKAAMNALEGVNIKQETLSDGTIEYTTTNKDGVEFKTKNPEELVMGLLGYAAQKSAEGRNIKLIEGRNIKLMPDGTMVEYDQNGKPTVLNDGINLKLEESETPKIKQEPKIKQVQESELKNIAVPLQENKILGTLSDGAEVDIQIMFMSEWRTYKNRKNISKR